MRVLLGVSGGIAAYKAVEVLRSLQEHGAEVDVIMTRSASRFIAPLTFSALSGKPVHTTLWQLARSHTMKASMEHITLAQATDVLLVAPATANTLARLAHGSASDLLSTVYLATPAPTVIAPAMNVQMWQHPATQTNITVLTDRGARLVGPVAGDLACGMTGDGRLAPVDAIVSATLNACRPKDLAGQTVLVTAGGTREAIDLVRYLGNRSSGRMGHAVAVAAQARGAEVILITAASLPAPPGVLTEHVETTEQMWQAIHAHLDRATIVCAAAAVADFRPSQPSSVKIRREGSLTLHLEPTPDLLARIAAQRKPGTLIIGFAAETHDLESNGRMKLQRKGVDAILANDISEAGIGFDSKSNAGIFITARAVTPLPKMTKRLLADRILDLAMKLPICAALRDAPDGNETQASPVTS